MVKADPEMFSPNSVKTNGRDVSTRSGVRSHTAGTHPTATTAVNPSSIPTPARNISIPPTPAYLRTVVQYLRNLHLGPDYHLDRHQALTQLLLTPLLQMCAIFNNSMNDFPGTSYGSTSCTRCRDCNHQCFDHPTSPSSTCTHSSYSGIWTTPQILTLHPPTAIAQSVPD